MNLLTAEDLFPQKVATYDPADPADARVLMPEYLSCEDRSGQVAAHVVEWLTQPAQRERLVAEMAVLKERVGHGGASRRAAEYVLAELAKVRPPALAAHCDFGKRRGRKFAMLRDVGAKRQAIGRVDR